MFQVERVWFIFFWVLYFGSRASLDKVTFEMLLGLFVQTGYLLG